MGIEIFGKQIVEASVEMSKEMSKNLKKFEDVDKRIDVKNKKSINVDKNDVREDVDKRINGKETNNIDKEREYNDRITQAKRSKGEWSGKPGESTLTLETGEKVEYKNGYPNFDNYSKGDVEINNMTSDLDKNWANASKAYAEQWNKECKDGKNDWTAKDVTEYKIKNNLEFHECQDMKTCQLVPKHIHQGAQHYGGRHECKIRGK